MKISILKSDAFKTKSWAGGITTELFIYPENTSYKKGDFDFRLSKAHVADGESVFTSLPNINRKLMVLEGEITLKHENQYSKQLASFDLDTFDGGWQTSSIGKCIDFNLMTKGKTNGDLIGFEILEGKSIEQKINVEYEFGFIYNFRGKTSLNIQDKLYHLEEGNLMVIKHLKPLSIQFNSKESSKIAFVTISVQ